MTKAGFGERLKREREMRGVSLDEICAATRIGNRFLEALESEDWDHLPGGVFNRGFVRAVARYLGLDEEGLVAEYVLATAEQTPTPEWAKPQAHVPAAPDHRLRWYGIGVVVIVIVVALSLWAWRSYSVRRAERRASAISSELHAQAAAQELPQVPLKSAEADAPAGGAASAGNSSAQDARPANLLQLKIEAGKSTSLSVSADGSKVFEGTMIPGQSRQFAAQIDFEVHAQDAGAVLLELNGQTLAPMGPPGRSAMVVLTRDDLKSAGGSH